MIRFTESLAAWGTPQFDDALRREIEQLDPAALPLQQGLAHGSHVADGPVQVRVIGASDDGDTLRARVGVFYAGIVGGCSCADDPTPVDELSEYCELRIEITRATAAATITLVTD